MTIHLPNYLQTPDPFNFLANVFKMGVFWQGKCLLKCLLTLRFPFVGTFHINIGQSFSLNTHNHYWLCFCTPLDRRKYCLLCTILLSIVNSSVGKVYETEFALYYSILNIWDNLSTQKHKFLLKDSNNFKTTNHCEKSVYKSVYENFRVKICTI